jgi:hypothetical protein
MEAGYDEGGFSADPGASPRYGGTGPSPGNAPATRGRGTRDDLDDEIPF